MCPNDFQFINILNRFSITSHTFGDISFINQICLRTPQIDNILPHLLYTNAKQLNITKSYYKTH